MLRGRRRRRRDGWDGRVRWGRRVRLDHRHGSDVCALGAGGGVAGKNARGARRLAASLRYAREYCKERDAGFGHADRTCIIIGLKRQVQAPVACLAESQGSLTRPR